MTATKLIEFHLWKIVNAQRIYLGLVIAWPGTALEITGLNCLVIKSEKTEIYVTPATDLVITKLTGNDPPIPITEFLESLKEAEEPLETE